MAYVRQYVYFGAGVTGWELGKGSGDPPAPILRVGNTKTHVLGVNWMVSGACLPLQKADRG